MPKAVKTLQIGGTGPKSFFGSDRQLRAGNASFVESSDFFENKQVRHGILWAILAKPLYVVVVAIFQTIIKLQ